MRPIRLKENIEMQMTALAKSGAVICETKGKGFTSAMDVYEACVRECEGRVISFIAIRSEDEGIDAKYMARHYSSGVKLVRIE